MVRRDGVRTELGANLVSSDRVEIAESEGDDGALMAQLIQNSEGIQISCIVVVLPMKLPHKPSIRPRDVVVAMRTYL